MTFTKIGILGSGIMGSGIAEVSAAAGATVILRSRSQETADKMLAGLEKSLAKQVEKGKRTQEDADQIRARVSATTNLTDLADCDLIIESVVENLDVKKQIFKELDETINKDAVLATNTSTLSVLELAAQHRAPATRQLIVLRNLLKHVARTQLKLRTLPASLLMHFSSHT